MMTRNSLAWLAPGSQGFLLRILPSPIRMDGQKAVVRCHVINLTLPGLVLKPRFGRAALGIPRQAAKYYCVRAEVGKVWMDLGYLPQYGT